MDTVYGTKKYFHSMVAENDCSRSIINRPMTSYSSYQNTLGRCSIPADTYNRMTQYVCSPPPNNGMTGSAIDLSLPSHYGGYYSNNSNPHHLWKDSRNLTHSSFGSSTRKKKSLKSFTVLLMTAAFIVMLAVLSVAAMAFYFSTYKSQSNDSIMVFDAKFQITKGDVFTTGLRYNHTSVYQQKAELYENLIGKALENNGLDVAKCEVTGFGNGPLLNVYFRIFLDMRMMPMNIKSVEEHIRESIMNEMTGPKALFKGVKIDTGSIVVKRLLDTELIQFASFFKEQMQTTSPSSVAFDNTYIPKTISPPKSTTKPKLLPSHSSSFSSVTPTYASKSNIVKGSFEVTKTDADITQKKTFVNAGTSTLRPFTVTNGSMKVKTKKITIEKVRPPIKNAVVESTTIVQRGKVESITETNHIKTTVTPIIESTTTLHTTTLSPKKKQTTTTTSTSTSTTTSPTPSTVTTEQTINLFSKNYDPWKPITLMTTFPTKNPTITHKIGRLNQTNFVSTTTSVPFKKIASTNHTFTPGFRPIFYQSFSNSGFSSDPHRFEQLGAGFVKPYPIPVNKISDYDTLTTEKIGTSTIPTIADITSTTEISQSDIITINPTSQIGAVLLDLLQNDKTFNIRNATLHQVLEKLDQFNMTSAKHSAHNNIEAIDDDEMEEIQLEQITSTSTAPPKKEIIDTSVATWTQPSLFPAYTKLTGNTNDETHDHSLRKVFNETLHAWIVDSPQKSQNSKSNRPIIAMTKSKEQSTNIKNISSIFDTLSSKLDMSAKNDETLRIIPSISNAKIQQVSRTVSPEFTATTTPSIHMENNSHKNRISTTAASAIAVIGEAEIEEVDPTQYEEMLMSDTKVSRVTSTTTLPPLITLMPVKSNSGIRPIFKNGILMEAHYSRRPTKRVSRFL